METNAADASYARLARAALEGAPAGSRAGAVAKIVGAQLRAPILWRGAWDLGVGFPLLTTKHVSFRLVATELMWFLRGETSAKWLEERGCAIWSADANALAARGFAHYVGERTLGPIYGAQWRGWRCPEPRARSDQISALLEGLRANPLGRRHLVSAWNVADLPAMALPPCHHAFQIVVEPDPAGEGVLRASVVVSMRSGDIALGLPFNLASYALLLCLVAREVDMVPGEVVLNIADAHVYRSHSAALAEQIAREPAAAPVVTIPPACGTVTRFAEAGGGPPESLPNFAAWVEPGYAPPRARFALHV